MAPSFNGKYVYYVLSYADIRRLLATAQLLAVTSSASARTRLQLITFDGDVTLYPDGAILHPDNPVIPYLLKLLELGVHIGIITAAGYPARNGKEYSNRLHGLLEAVAKSFLPEHLKSNLAIIGGECNYLFRFNGELPKLLEWVDEDVWRLDVMQQWEEEDVQLLLDIAERSLTDCAEALRLDVQIIRKPRAVGIFFK